MLAAKGLVFEHAKLKTLVTGLAFKQFQGKIKGASAWEVNGVQPPICLCKLEWLIICMLNIQLMGVTGYLHLRCK